MSDTSCPAARPDLTPKKNLDWRIAMVALVERGSTIPCKEHPGNAAISWISVLWWMHMSTLTNPLIHDPLRRCKFSRNEKFAYEFASTTDKPQFWFWGVPAPWVITIALRGGKVTSPRRWQLVSLLKHFERMFITTYFLHDFLET